MKKAIVVIILALMLIGVFGCLIIYVTPHLYHLHPINRVDSVGALSHKVIPVVEYEDTVFVKKDTVIIHRSIPQADTIHQSPDMGDLGTFGDSAGFWNAIFSALAMVGVIVTLLYQLTKDKQDDERARLEQFQEQCLTMLSMLSEIVSQLRIPQPSDEGAGSSHIALVTSPWESRSNNPTIPVAEDRYAKREAVTGRDCFKYIYDERPYRRNIRDHIAERGGGKDSFVLSEELFTSLRSVTETYFDHYFRTVYRTLKFIKERDLGNIPIKKQEETRDLCADLLRAQLSTYELAVLYYNALYPKFRTTSKAIFEYFCIFDNLDPKYLITGIEKDYYQRVRDSHTNPEEYDPKIHYNCLAFVNTSDSSNKKKFIQIIIEWVRDWKRRVWSNSDLQEDSGSDLDDVSQRIYNVLFDVAGQPITIRELGNRSECKKGLLRKKLDELEENGYISVSSSSKGKIYSILKDIRK